MDVLVPFDEISLEWEELKHTLQRCEDSLTVASRLQSFIQVHGDELPGNIYTVCFYVLHYWFYYVSLKISYLVVFVMYIVFCTAILNQSC